MSHSIEPLDISSEKAASLKTVYHPRQRLMRDYSEVFDTALLKHIKDLGQPREDIRWESRKHLISTSICNSIGVACVWRFPVYCYKYGGASFLYVFIFLLFVIGHPLFYFEIFLGQITPKHPSGRFKMVPLFEGLGWAMCLVVLVMLLYYSILCSYFIIYLTSSVSKEFPWTTCESKPCLNKTVNCSAQTPPEKFFYFDVVGKENDQVVVHWPVFTFLSGIWITVYILLVVDIRLSKLLPTFLFIIMFLLMIPMFVGAQLTDGALRGWIEFVKPTHWNIINFELWWNALSQVLFALGLSSGITSSFGSYSQFMAPVHKDCVTICFIVLLASFLTGSIAFSGFGILGYKVSESCFIHLTKSDAGSVFVFYSVAFANLPFRQGLAFSLYFVTTLQVLFCMVMMEETLLLVVCEHFKELKGHRASALALITFFLFVCSLPGTTNKGDEFVMLLDYYPVGNGLSVISMCETFVILLIGYRRLNSNKLFKFGKPIGKYFKYTWYITPGVLLVVAIAHLITVFHPEGRFVHQWPIGIGWKIAGWILFAAVLLPILIKCGHNIYIFWYKKRKVKELFYATESVNVLKMPRFTQAPPPADRPKLVPSPAESSSTDPQPGPSRPHQKYYMLPPHYFNIQLDEDD